MWESSIWLSVFFLAIGLSTAYLGLRRGNRRWHRFRNHFARGLDSDNNLSRMDRQQRAVDTVFWLLFLTPIVAGALYLFIYR